ncbi:hypothetical protein F444_00746 [Phytophthora nicotianae P1976]|uniref:Uncharacterized protein n=1 Tax=Phytophthora nicotianae P1976 TaxID=1317066 RepID=A0A081B384_PHYNI|nr:hypothetical protein F444_00746 [Phytophthora nicotianae P1976]
MSVAVWFYCNVLDEVSAVVPVVQIRQNAVDDVPKAPAVRSTSELALGAEVDDELAVGRSTYVMAAAFSATTDSKVVKVEAKVKKTVVEHVAATEKVVAEVVEVDVAEPEEEVANKAEEAVETVKEEVAKEEIKNENVKPVEEELVEQVIVDKVEQEALDDAAAEVVNEVIEESLTVAEDAVTVEAEVEETISEVTSVVETVRDAVETVAVVDEVIVESVVAQTADEEEKSDEVEAAKEESASVAAELPTSLKLSSDIPDQKPVDTSEDVVEEPKPLIPDELNAHEDKLATEDTIVKDTELVECAAQDVDQAEESEPAKPVADYESETETQSEISEAPVEVAKVVEEPESEIDETMVIDPVVAAKEAAAVEAQASSFSFIPEQIRKHSYAASSVAVAVTTAIVATLVARR